MAGTRRRFLRLIGAGVISAAAILHFGLAGQGDWPALPGPGRLAPTVWSPGESAGVRQLDKGWTGPKPGHGAACTPVVLTPVGFAIGQPMAEALGWPASKVGWKAVIDLASPALPD